MKYIKKCQQCGKIQSAQEHTNHLCCDCGYTLETVIDRRVHDRPIKYGTRKTDNKINQ